MHRKVRSLFLPLTFGLMVSIPLFGCQQTGGASGGGSGGSKTGGTTAKGGSGGSQNGGSGGGGSGGSNTGGTTVKGGSGGSNSGGSNPGGSGGNNSGGSNPGGSGGSNPGGSGGSNPGGSGGSNPGGAGGTSPGGAGGTSPGGSGGGGSTSAGEMISDFEDSPPNATMIQAGNRTGYWYVYFPGSDTGTAPKSGMTISPALNNGKPVTTEKDSSNALHFKGSGYGSSSGDNYAGTGAAFHPNASNYKISEAYDVSSYTGISFKVKAGSGTQPALFFEMLTKENQPSTSGGSATNQKIDLYNTRGHMLYTPWTPSAISSSWQTITIPFGTLVPRWVPDSTGCGTAPSTPKCQALPFVPKNVLGIQISSYQDNGFPKVSGATAGTFDIWIDDVQFTKDDSGLQKRTGFPIANSGSWGSCIKPQGPSADAKFLVPAYNQWKATFVKNNAVIRPENANDAVSESIAYGMLIAVNMNDQALFDSLYSFWTGHIASGSLMTWCIPGAGGGGGTGSACSASGGSATDADEDAAFALLMADKAWGGSYKSKAMTMISDIWSSDIDSGTSLPKGGSNYGAPTGTSGTNISNPSYFAPAYYKAFKAAGDSHGWDGVVSAVYKSIASLTGSNGLPAAWCGGSSGSPCSTAASNGASTDTDYQYDSHRIPMRLGLDYCWNGQAEAKTFTSKNTAFFVSQAANGIGYVLDMYTPSGGSVSGTAPNSASILGTAGVGAMATGNQTFLNDAYQSVFDSITRGVMAPVDAAGKTPYSYFNATVGLLTALMMTGNFMH
jgi:endo-1,4-beta-D-glucanase Y